jgi:hypothetical protein
VLAEFDTRVGISSGFLSLRVSETCCSRLRVWAVVA